MPKDVLRRAFYPILIIEAANVPADIGNYKYGPEEVKICQPEYDLSTGKFQGLYKTVGLIIVRGDNDETFFNFGFEKEKYKLIFCAKKKHSKFFLRDLIQET